MNNEKDKINEQQVIDFYLKGFTQREIGYFCDVSYMTISRILKKNNITARKGAKRKDVAYRKCYFCGETKVIEEFTRNKNRGYGYDYVCKECSVIKGRRNTLKKKYGLSKKEFEKIKEVQGDVCAICGKPEEQQRAGKIRELSVDHDHKTGKVRGLLCSKCNIGLGVFRENISILLNAIKYIESNKKGD